MFPKTFSARVAERMAIWGAMLGFLALLFAATAWIESGQMAGLSAERQLATTAAMEHVKSGSADRTRAETLVATIEAVNAKQAEYAANHRQNRNLLVLLTLFVVGLIVTMEYRLLIKPIVRMAALLQRGQQTPKTLAQYARRRDEIGAFAHALTAHFQLVRKEQDASTAEQVAAVAAGISQSMREQDSNSQAITSTTARTADDVREVATTVQDVASMIGEAKTAADLVTKVSTDLGRQASDLRGAVERFIETTDRIAS